MNIYGELMIGITGKDIYDAVRDIRGEAERILVHWPENFFGYRSNRPSLKIRFADGTTDEGEFITEDVFKRVGQMIEERLAETPYHDHERTFKVMFDLDWLLHYVDDGIPNSDQEVVYARAMTKLG